MNQRTVNYLVFAGIGIAFILMIYIAVIAKSDGGKCQLSPLTYGVQKLYEANNNKEISCSCLITDPITRSGMIGASPILIFDRHNISLKDTSIPEQFYPLINDSKLFIFNVTK